ncbi:hypothetical protein P280DRAFT_429762, partial [Massarina eburnea CBS 473.64]
MPVTIKIAPHDARPVHLGSTSTSPSSRDVLLKTLNQRSAEAGKIIQTSLTDERLKSINVHSQDHGLIRATYTAWNNHHHLVLRPEDIWFAILTQFSFYVNAHAEELRKSFVTHKGKKGLILRAPGENDMGLMCRNMTRLIDENIVDPDLRAWILPNFSTTTLDDEAVAAVIMMGTLQRYFEYSFDPSTCGIPSVTLLGEKEDWQEISRRIEKLKEYGEEPSRFAALLKPILREIVACFDAPVDDTFAADFWNRSFSYSGGSGADTMTGWITVFCFWDEDGKRLARVRDGVYLSMLENDIPRRLKDIICLELEMNKVPCGFVTVPVLYITPESERIECKLLAGFAGYEATATMAGQADVHETSTETGSSELDTLRPITAWWMYEFNN